jgi:hypothetical protein
LEKNTHGGSASKVCKEGWALSVSSPDNHKRILVGNPKSFPTIGDPNEKKCFSLLSSENLFFRSFVKNRKAVNLSA